MSIAKSGLEAKMTTHQYKTFGFVGLGLMGKPMAINLAQKLAVQHKMFIYDLIESAVLEVCQSSPDNVTMCSSAMEVAEKSDVIITMLPEGRHIKSVYIESERSLSMTDLNGKLLIDCSTIDTATNLLVKDHLNQAFPEALFYDAPVSGGTIGAINGTIAFFLGCDKSDASYSCMQTILGCMGTEIIACGGPSLGLASKLANNYLSGTITIACSEAFDMGVRSGVDPYVLYRVFGAGTAQNTICDKFCPFPNICPDAPSSKGYQGGFKIQLMHKDYALAMEMARGAGSKPILGGVGLNAWNLASHDATYRDLDSRVIYQYVRDRGQS